MPTYVGIGTTVEHGMEVVGDAIIEGQEGGPLSTRVPFELFSNVSGNSTIADSRQMRLRVQPSNEISPDDSYVVDMGIQNTTDNFFFITAPQNTSITGTQRSFVITKTSNVGVGTAEPLEKFHVQGDVKANVVNAYTITGTPNLDMMGTFANVTATSNVVISGTNSTLSATADIATNAVNTVMTSTGDLSTNSVNTTLSSTGDLSTNSVNTTLSSTGDLSTNSVNTTLSSTGDLSTNSVNTTLSSTGDLSTNSVNTTLSSTGDTTASSVNTTLTTTGDITAKSVNTTLTSTGILDMRAPSILATGNVGVGTATPLEKLHVFGDIRSNALTTSTVTGLTDLDLVATSNANISSVNTTLTTTGDITAKSVNTTLTSTGILDMRAPSILATGNVGVGTATPLEKLHVFGDIRSNALTTSTVTGLTGLDLVANTDLTASSVNTTLTTTGDITAKSVNTTLTSTGILDMRAPSIIATGNVGVGTATPLEKLHVFGDIRSNALATSTVTGLTDLDLVSTSNTNISSVNTTLTTTGDITAKSVNTTLTSTGILDMRAPSILATGNVGVGTATPLEKLHVFGDIRSNALTTSTVTGLTDLDLVATSNTNISSVNTIVTSSANTFVSGDNIILNTSNVGIGTATPMATLHVQGDFKATGNVEIGVVSYNKVLGAGPIFTITTTDIMLLGSTAVGTTGTVGVGTTVPETSLQVLGDVAIGKSGENAGPHTLFFGGLVNDASLAETVIENRTHDGANGTELLLFKGNNADASNGYDRIRLRAGRIVLDTFPSTTISRTGENPRVTILEDGKVGIGKTDPGYTLEVAGSTKFDGGAMYFGTTEGLTSITTLRVTIGTQGGLGGTKQVQATWPNSYSISARLMVQVTIDIDGISNDDDDTFMTTVTGVSTTGCKINVRKFNGGTWATTLYAMVTVFELSASP